MFIITYTYKNISSDDELDSFIISVHGVNTPMVSVLVHRLN